MVNLKLGTNVCYPVSFHSVITDRLKLHEVAWKIWQMGTRLILVG